MLSDEDWDAIRPQRQPQNTFGQSALRITLLFGALAFAFALLVMPLVSPDSPRRLAIFNPGVDPVTTATIRRSQDTYTMRRSVLQKKKSDVCIIRANGNFEGDC